MTIKALYPSIRPTIDLRFAQSQRLGELVTFSRASSATRVNERGDIEIVPAGQPRFEHNYNTFELEGLLIESFSATNLITHSVPVVPSGGGLPDGWVQDQLQPGITYATVGSGIEKGLSYVDIQFSGTTTGANRTLIRPGNSFAVTSGQSFIASVYAKIISGVVPSGARCDWSPANGGVNIGQNTASLVEYRVNGSAYTSAGTCFPRFDIGPMGSGTTVDFSIRLAAPQLINQSQSPYSTFIPTNGTAATRSADLATIPLSNPSIRYNPSGSTFAIEVRMRAFNSARLVSFDNSTFGTCFSTAGNDLFNASQISGPSQTNNPFTPMTQTVTYGSRCKAATRIIPGEAGIMCVNGLPPVIHTGGTASGTTFSGVTVLLIGPATGNSGGALISRLSYWPSGLSTNTLQALSV